MKKEEKKPHLQHNKDTSNSSSFFSLPPLSLLLPRHRKEEENLNWNKEKKKKNLSHFHTKSNCFLQFGGLGGGGEATEEGGGRERLNEGREKGNGRERKKGNKLSLHPHLHPLPFLPPLLRLRNPNRPHSPPLPCFLLYSLPFHLVFPFAVLE